MSRVPLPRSLFAQTGLALPIAFVLFLALIVGIAYRLILQPVTEHAVEDLAALMVLSVQTWAELPPDTRQDYQQELERRHHLLIQVLDRQHPAAELRPANRLLVEAIRNELGQRLAHPVPAGLVAGRDGWYWFEIPMAERQFRVGVAAIRLIDRTPIAALLILVAGAVFILVTSLLLVQRLIHPLARLGERTESIGKGEFPQPLAESGPREIAALARCFNRMVSQLEQLTANRTTLLAGISHDIRTPLTRMGLAIAMLPKDVEPELLDQLQRDVTEMNALIDQVMELSRGMQGQDAHPFDLVCLLQQLGHKYREAESAVQLSTPASCPVVASEIALRRVVTNLLENALRYGDGKPVELGCSCENGRVRIVVSDQGPGVPATHRDQVFQPFYRVEDSRSRKTGGSGLGLAIVKQLADANGWQVTLEESRSGGAQFSVELPAPPGREAVTALPRSGQATQPEPGEQIATAGHRNITTP